MVIVPAAFVPDVLKDAEAAGVKSATVYAAAVGDGDSPASRERGAWLKQFVATSKLRVSGPNCMGSYSYPDRLYAYPNTELCSMPAGPVGGIFQSGGTMQFWMKTAGDRGLRFSYVRVVGQRGRSRSRRLSSTFSSTIRTPKQIVLFIEGIRRPQAFMRAAGRALEAGKPVLAIKTGATAKSQSAAASHTGAIGGDYAAYLAMCERYGICNCRSLDDLVETTLAFQCGRRPKGPRIGFVTTSGGTVDLLYDYAEAEGVGDPGIFRRDQRRADAAHAGRHHAEKSARHRHSDDDEGRGRPDGNRRQGSERRHRRLGRGAARQGRHVERHRRNCSAC